MDATKDLRHFLKEVRDQPMDATKELGFRHFLKESGLDKLLEMQQAAHPYVCSMHNLGDCAKPVLTDREYYLLRVEADGSITDCRDSAATTFLCCSKKCQSTCHVLIKEVRGCFHGRAGLSTWKLRGHWLPGDGEQSKDAGVDFELEYGVAP
ncbi:hypothetical protein WJX72_011876 [[Myrmecia] bisecta]|uniref:Uncharacterized protein n=1 Tax=[Myrmecia] bisecta TaxID=41462 RepID=A0AAW1PZN1_9CHLO